jgi:tRNA pseudouridine55 synthase
MHLDADKSYEATLHLGVKTSTADAEGEALSERQVAVSLEDIERVVHQFTGAIRQVPPMHSALKKDGRALYEYARAGIEVERAARDVTIYALRVLEMPTEAAPHALRIEVSCSKGTYIRTLGEDMGEALDCGAHLSALRRTRTGGFAQTQCVSLEALEAMTAAQRLGLLLPVDALLQGHQRVTLESESAARFLSGVRRRGDWPDAEQVAVYAAAPPALLGTGRVVAGELIPVRLLSPQDIGEVQAQNTALAQAGITNSTN